MKHPYLGLAIALAGVLALHTCAAWGQIPQACAARETLLESLKSGFGEVPAGFGMTGNGGVFELLVSPGGSWSLILSLPDGKSCLLATGDGWETTRQPGKDI